MMTIANALAQASKEISAISTCAQLDAEVLLAHILQVPRSYFYTWPARVLTTEEQARFETVVKRKVHGEPVAYITGTREFWSLDFKVTADTLIPRPETELVVEIVLEKFNSQNSLVLADLGTGCGAIACAIASEKPEWKIHATDRVEPALAVARENARCLQLTNIIFAQGDWCEALPSITFDAIMSNPPYIAKDDSELNRDVIESEPHAALFADEHGYKDIRQIINGAKGYLKTGGYLIIEHGSQQAIQVRQLFINAGYTGIQLYKDIANRDRVTAACLAASIAS
jgi:release factor glutamine methyltransferase